MGSVGAAEQARFGGIVAIQQAIGAARGDLATVMNAIVAERAVMPQANGAVVELRDGDHLTYAAASGTSVPLLGLRLALNRSLSGLCVLTGEPQVCRDAETDPRVNIEACRRVGLRSMIVLPIPHHGQTAGVLKYHAPEPSAFDDTDLLIGHLLVGPIAVGMSSVSEADALKAQIELRRLVEMKEQLVATVSHELRTPITSIAGSLNLLEVGAGGVLPERAADLVGIASRNAARLRRIVDDLLDVGKLHADEMSFALAEVDLADVLRQAAEQCGPFAEQAGVALRYLGPSAGVAGVTDGHRLIQAVTNLLSNAAKFSPAGSVVDLALAVVDGQAVIRVADRGLGVPAEFRARLFDQFSQRDAVSPKGLAGTGLGLAITRGIARRLGGDVTLDETYTEGAAFELRVPLVAVVAAAA